MTATAQASIYETTIENAEIEAALEQRQKLKERISPLRKQLNEADEIAKGMIDQLDLGDDAPVRIGRFLVTRKPIPARSVAFDVDETSQLRIGLIPDLA